MHAYALCTPSTLHQKISMMTPLTVPAYILWTLSLLFGIKSLLSRCMLIMQAQILWILSMHAYVLCTLFTHHWRISMITPLIVPAYILWSLSILFEIMSLLSRCSACRHRYYGFFLEGELTMVTLPGLHT